VFFLSSLVVGVSRDGVVEGGDEQYRKPGDFVGVATSV
jgi:hypothetical protein